MSKHLSHAWIEHFRESAREGVLPTAKGTEALLAHIDAQAATIQRVKDVAKRFEADYDLASAHYDLEEALEGATK